MTEYKKPKNKSTLTVQFEIDDQDPEKTFKQKMELPLQPRVGEMFHHPNNQKRYRITQVIYQPWNEFDCDIVVRGELNE